MPSTYTANLGVEKPATGEQAGAWGNTANTSYDTIDMAICGNLTVALSASTYTLATNNGGAAAGGVNRLVIWTSTQTQVGTVTITPNTAKKIYIMQNKTAGGFAINFTQGGGSVFTLQPGYSAILYTDGAGSGASVLAALDSPQFANALITGNLQVTGSLTYGSAQTFTQAITFNGAVNLNGATTAVNLTVNPSGATSATWDLYYRSASGALARLAVGSPGQFLTVTAGPVIQWAIPPATQVGSVIAGSTANAIYFASPSGTLTQDTSILINNTVGIGVGVLPSHSLHVGYARAPELWLDTNNPGAQQRQIVFATNNAPRWYVYSPPAAESGGNQGSYLGVLAMNDPANASRWVLYLSRSDGNVTIGPPGGDQGARLAVLGDNSGQYGLLLRGATGQSASLQTWQNSGGANVAWMDAAGNLTCNNLTCNNLSAGGAFNFTSLTLSGNLYVARNITTGQKYFVNVPPDYAGVNGQIPYVDTVTGIGYYANFVYGILVGSQQRS